MTTAYACSYCGLPLTTGWWPWGRHRPANGNDPTAGLEIRRNPVFCCSGCRFAAEVSAESSSGATINKPLAQPLGIAVFLTVNVLMFTMVLWSNDVYSPAGAGSNRFGIQLDDVFRWLVLVLSMPVVWLLAGPLVSNSCAGTSPWRCSGRSVARAGDCRCFCVFVGFRFARSGTHLFRSDVCRSGARNARSLVRIGWQIAGDRVDGFPC